ncbi:MAG: EAL domain-containing protein [Pseudomonadota bacterium]|nr:EAL domain-containing protein [Pseudomonadota bacterium]
MKAPVPRRPRRWPRFGFRAKIITLLTLSLLATLATTSLVVNLTVQAAAADRLERELDVGERVWTSFYAARNDALLDSVGVLARDFGFKAAAALGEEATARSALANQGARIDASLALLLDNAGQVTAGASHGTRASHAAALATVLDRARRDGRASGVVVHQGRAHLVAMVPVEAPTRIGWVVMGRELDSAFAEQFHALTGLHLVLRMRAGSDQRGLPAAATLDPRQASPTADRDGETVADLHVSRLAPMPAGHHELEAVLLASRDSVIAPFRHLQRQILALAAAAALLALVVASLIARGVSRPVAQLGLAARRIEAGQYDLPLPPLGTDELGELGAAFNRMQLGIAEREQQVVHQASHDSLTGLPNRSQALSVLQRIIDGEAGLSGAVLMLDLDRFKEINDTLGHGFGDQVLVQVAQRLRSVLRPVDLLARLGGDEFLVVLEDVDADAADARARALAGALRTPLRLDATQVSLDVSIGVALYPQHGGTSDVLMRRADIAMYEAKALHSRVALYQPGRDEQHLRQLVLLADLRRALAEGELSLVFQPKIDVVTGQVVHAEALLRWAHPTLGKVAPDEFIPLAERSGLIHEVTGFVLDESLRQQKRWTAQGLELSVAVNISAIDLLDPKFPDRVLEALANHAVQASRLIVEITESTLMRDLKSAVQVLQRLRDAGVRLSIDDFGTGHSSLSQLRRLPVDEIKIDKSFVTGLDADSEDAVIVRSAIEIGHNMGLRVIAEGVETQESLDLLRLYRCDLVQGYFFSRPLETAAFMTWCLERASRRAETFA